MWVLTNVNNDEAKCFKMGQNTVKVGRKGSDLCLGNDPSISRQHAELSVVTKNGKEFLQVEDVGSRYGTYINNNIQPVSSTRMDTNNKMTQHSKVLLKSGDKIRFGLQWNIWFVDQKNYAVSSSKLDSKVSGQLQTKLQELEVPFKSDWDASCTHLTMSGLVVTPKVVSALASGKHIVTLDFWTQISQVLRSGAGFYPKEEEYLPPVMEQAARYQSVSFLPNPVRSKLFKGLKFVALSQQQMRYLEQCVTLGGGTIVNMNREKFTKGDLLNEKTIVLSKSTLHVDSQQTQVNSVVERLKSLFAKTNKRLVDESEIGFAIMFASRDAACNPYVEFNLPEYSQSLDNSQDSDSNVFSASMIKTPHSARKRNRSPSPNSEGKKSKRLMNTGSTHFTPKSLRESSGSGHHSEEMMTFRDTQKTKSGTFDSDLDGVEIVPSTGEIEGGVHSNVTSKVVKDTDDSNTSSGTSEKNSKLQVGRGRFQRSRSSQNSGNTIKTRDDNDSSEDELENMFSKCQKMIRNKTGITESTNFGSGSSTNLESRSSLIEETRESVFQKPTASVQSGLPLKNKDGNKKLSSGGSLDSWVSRDKVPKTLKRDTSSTLNSSSSFTGKQNSANTTNKLNSSRFDTNEDEEDLFEHSTLSRRHSNMNNSVAGMSTTTRGNTLGNTSGRSNSLWNRNQSCLPDDEDEDNVFGAPMNTKPLSRRTQVDTDTVTDSDDTSINGTGKKRGYEEDTGREMFRSAEVQDLQDRGLIQDECDSVSIDTNCCVISVEFKLKEYKITPRLQNKKVFKKQSLPPKHLQAPITFYPVFATVLDSIIKPDIGTPCKTNGINGDVVSNGDAFETPCVDEDLDGTFEPVSSQAVA